MTAPDSFVVYCADVGSLTNGNFGWARARAEGEETATPRRERRSIRQLARRVAEDLEADRPVALGFECPLYVPLRNNLDRLTSQRPGEDGRPWSGGAGPSSLTTGLVEARWLLEEIDRLLDDAGVQIGEPKACLDWATFTGRNAPILLWEAHVSKEAHSDDDIQDAKTGVRTFLDTLAVSGDPDSASEDTDSPILSLIGTVLLRIGWSSDPSILEEPCIRLMARDAHP